MDLRLAGILVFLVVILQVQKVESHVVLEVNLIQFRDGRHALSGVSGCQYVFDMCLATNDRLNFNDDITRVCNLGDYEKTGGYNCNAVIKFESDMRGVPNPVKYFLYTWKDSVYFKVNVAETHPDSTSVVIDNFILTVTKATPDKSKDAAVTHQVELDGISVTSQKSRLTLSYKVYEQVEGPDSPPNKDRALDVGVATRTQCGPRFLPPIWPKFPEYARAPVYMGSAMWGTGSPGTHWEDKIVLRWAYMRGVRFHDASRVYESFQTMLSTCGCWERKCKSVAYVQPTGTCMRSEFTVYSPGVTFDAYLGDTTYYQWYCTTQGSPERKFSLSEFPIYSAPTSITTTTFPTHDVFECSFESDDLCGMKQLTEDSMDWVRLSRTYAHAGLYYIYLEGTHKSQGDYCSISTPPLQYTGKVCVEFYYIMYGGAQEMASLSVILHPPAGQTRPPARVIFNKASNQGKPWQLARVSVDVQIGNTVMWTAIRGRDYMIGIAIDSIKITGDSCCVKQDCVWVSWSLWLPCAGGKQSRARRRYTARQCGGQDCTGPSTDTRYCNSGCNPIDCMWGSWSQWSTCYLELHARTRSRVVEVGAQCGGKLCKGPVSELDQNCRSSKRELFLCSFESDMCGMNQASNDVTDWERLSGPTPSGNTGPSSAKDGAHYIYLEASGKAKTDSSSISTPPLQHTGEVCVEFYYHMYGSEMGELRMVLQPPVGQSALSSSILFSEQRDQGNSWKQKKETVNLQVENMLTWTAIRGNGYRSDIAIDGIKITDGKCSDDTPCVRLDCIWDNWSSWSPCSGLGGVETRTRKPRQEAECSGTPCSGGSLESRPCTTQCGSPVDCVWSAWTSWTKCGFYSFEQKRTRTKTVLSACRGKECIGIDSNTRWCCTPQDCVWSEWLPWSVCDSATKTRKKKKVPTATLR